MGSVVVARFDNSTNAYEFSWPTRRMGVESRFEVDSRREFDTIESSSTAPTVPRRHELHSLPCERDQHSRLTPPLLVKCRGFYDGRESNGVTAQRAN